VTDTWYDLGELAQLVSRLGARGAAITLTPAVRETDGFIGGFHKPKTVLTTDHWNIRYVYDDEAEVVVEGRTLREAVDAALADLNRRASKEGSR
jgi:hypothetical protein